MVLCHNFARDAAADPRSHTVAVREDHSGRNHTVAFARIEICAAGEEIRHSLAANDVTVDRPAVLAGCSGDKRAGGGYPAEIVDCLGRHSLLLHSGLSLLGPCQFDPSAHP